jgi:hypothetical protein
MGLGFDEEELSVKLDKIIISDTDTDTDTDTDSDNQVSLPSSKSKPLMINLL